MNRAAIRTLVRAWINEPTPGFFLDSSLDLFIGLASDKLNSLVSQLNEDFFTRSATFSVVSGTSRYDVPGDFVALRRLEKITDDPLQPDRIRSFHFPDTERDAGTLMRYHVRNGQIEFNPIPDGNTAGIYNLFYVYTPAQIAIDTHSPAIPAQFHDLVALWAVILALPANNESSAEFIQIYNDREQQLVNHVVQTEEGHEVIFGVTEGRH